MRENCGGAESGSSSWGSSTPEAGELSADGRRDSRSNCFVVFRGKWRVRWGVCFLVFVRRGDKRFLSTSHLPTHNITPSFAEVSSHCVGRAV